MSKYADRKHPPNANHAGEEPRTGIDVGPHGITVTLDAWGPQEHLFTTLYDTSTATWGDAPTRSKTRPCSFRDEDHGPLGRDVHAAAEEHYMSWEHKTGWCRLSEDERAWVENCFAGGTLQQDLEGINLWFTIDGVTRAFTHEFVRTRLGAAFKQHGGRDNDWRHRRWTMTEAIDRACNVIDLDALEVGKRDCLTTRRPIDAYLDTYASNYDFQRKDATLRDAIETYLIEGKRLYAALVDAGVAWQDARRVLPIGTQTYVHGIYNYVGFRGAAANRLEFIMDWEINCVFQLMLREITMKCPPIMSQFLGSHSDIAGKAMFDQLELCPPDGKYPSTTIRCKRCGHAETVHDDPPIGFTAVLPGERICRACSGERGDVAPLHRFEPEDTLPRVFRREQQPFWVLHPESMKGGPIQWLWTNGHYDDIQSQL